MIKLVSWAQIKPRLEYSVRQHLISSIWGPSWQALYSGRQSVPMPVCMYVCCSPPVISYLCLRLHQPASSPATSQPTSTSQLLRQRQSRGYFFCFSHLLFLHPYFYLFSTLTLSLLRLYIFPPVSVCFSCPPPPPPLLLPSFTFFNLIKWKMDKSF